MGSDSTSPRASRSDDIGDMQSGSTSKARPMLGSFMVGGKTRMPSQLTASKEDGVSDWEVWQHVTG